MRGIMNRVDSLSVLRAWYLGPGDVFFLNLGVRWWPPVSSFQYHTSHSSIRRCRIIIENLSRTCCAVTEAKGKLPD